MPEADWARRARRARRAVEFRMPAGETLTGVLADYAEVARQADDLVATLPDLEATRPLPKAPWSEPGAQWSARRVLMHIIAETPPAGPGPLGRAPRADPLRPGPPRPPGPGHRPCHTALRTRPARRTGPESTSHPSSERGSDSRHPLHSEGPGQRPGPCLLSRPLGGRRALHVPLSGRAATAPSKRRGLGDRQPELQPGRVQGRAAAVADPSGAGCDGTEHGDRRDQDGDDGGEIRKRVIPQEVDRGTQ